MKLLVYVPILTPRIKYIFNFIFTEVLQTQVGFTSILGDFRASALPKISYGNRPIGDEIFFKNTDLLLEHKVARPNIKTTVFGDSIVPFAVTDSALPFDVFAASFYFVSRYEEYLPRTSDADGSFPVKLSLQNKLKLLEIPVIDAWALILKNILIKRYPELHFFKKKFHFGSFVCMYPESSATALTLKNGASEIFRRIIGVFRAKVSEEFRLQEIQQAVQQMERPYRFESRFFYKVNGAQTEECYGEIGLPGTYLKLLKFAVTKDYRMGYTKTPGFRAGTCTPFYWYDLQLEKTTHLLVHPIAVTDLSLPEKHLNSAEIISKWKDMFDTVKLLDGHFFMVWHYDKLTDDERGRKVRNLYHDMLSNFLTPIYDFQPQ
ncbi:MAG: hypothetical protein EOO20_07975 [Chryseobacterium sp.]|nr:MAG: hypothetical protein EOO20_07975 [Chryseobacterium sp.]